MKAIDTIKENKRCLYTDLFGVLEYPMITLWGGIHNAKEPLLSLLAGKATSPTLAGKIIYFRGEGACLKPSWNYVLLSKQPLSWISPPFPLSLSSLFFFSILRLSFFHKLHIFYPLLAAFFPEVLIVSSFSSSSWTHLFLLFLLKQTSWLRRNRSNENYDWDPSHCSISTALVASHALIYSLNLETISYLFLWIKVL